MLDTLRDSAWHAWISSSALNDQIFSIYRFVRRLERLEVSFTASQSLGIPFVRNPFRLPVFFRCTIYWIQKLMRLDNLLNYSSLW